MIKKITHSNDKNEYEVFETNLKDGLSDAQVKIRIEEGAVNKTKKRSSKSYLKIIVDNFFNLFNIMLFLIFLMMLIAQDYTGMFFIFIVVCNIGFGLFQDIRARILIDKLKLNNATKVEVIRNSESVKIQDNEVVLSDILVFKTGDQIIADCVVLSGEIEVNESILTGESENVYKKPGDKIFSGTFVTSGKATVRTITVGKKCFIETLEENAKTFKRPKSEILKSYDYILRFVGVFVVVAAIMYFISYSLGGKLPWPGLDNMIGSEFQESISRISGSLVSMIPSGMYLLTSCALTIGVISLSKKKMMVQELYCIEMLARVDTLCLDKTGTLTDGTMNVIDVINLDKKYDSVISSYLYTIVKSTQDSNSTAQAIINYFDNKTIVMPFDKIFPFNSQRKYSATTLKDNKTIILGAPEYVCLNNKTYHDEIIKLEKEGNRVLLLAITSEKFDTNINIKNTLPLAIVVLEDHIKDDAISNIQWFKDNGVDIKIISGDNPITVSAIAKRVGVEGYDNYVSLHDKSDEEVRLLANTHSVFGRVSPEQKEILVNSMRDDKHVVAMTGDGVNDILALKSADCSIAMASGSSAARNASHLVSVDSNFSSLPNVVYEGRRVINNLQRSSSLFLVKTTFAIVITIVFMILGWFNEEIKYPFTTNDMYIWEFATIGIASFFLALQPSNEKPTNTFISNILTKTIPAAIVQILIVVGIYIYAYCNKDIISLEQASSMSVIVFSLFSFIILIKLAWPLDLYRGILVSSLLLATLGAIAIDANFLGNRFFQIDYSLLTNQNTLVTMIVTFLIALIIYIPLSQVFSKINTFIHKEGKE